VRRDSGRIYRHVSTVLGPLWKDGFIQDVPSTGPRRLVKTPAAVPSPHTEGRVHPTVNLLAVRHQRDWLPQTAQSQLPIAYCLFCPLPTACCRLRR